MCSHQADWLSHVYTVSGQEVVTLHVVRAELNFFGQMNGREARI
jgi:hypothetical protein